MIFPVESIDDLHVDNQSMITDLVFWELISLAGKWSGGGVEGRKLRDARSFAPTVAD